MSTPRVASPKEPSKNIREALFADAPAIRTKLVELKDGTKVTLRQPTVGLRNTIGMLCRHGEGGMASFNPMEFSMRCVVCCTYDEANVTRVFQNGDYEEVSELSPQTEWLELLMNEILDLINVDVESQKGN